MVALSQLATLIAGLSPVTSAFYFLACTDDACSENCVDFSQPDVDGETGCGDFGFVAYSVYWYDTTNVLDLWVQYRGQCLDGPGSEDVWVPSGQTVGSACINIYESFGGGGGVQYWIANSWGE
jgi:hypothetical protein